MLVAIALMAYLAAFSHYAYSTVSNAAYSINKTASYYLFGKLAYGLGQSNYSAISSANVKINEFTTADYSSELGICKNAIIGSSSCGIVANGGKIYFVVVK